MGGFGDTSRAAMIGSVLFMGNRSSGGCAEAADSELPLADDIFSVDILFGCTSDLTVVVTEAGLAVWDPLGIDSCGVMGALDLAGIGGLGLLGGLEGSGVVSRRTGSTLLADIARSTRGEEDPASLDVCLGRIGACL